MRLSHEKTELRDRTVQDRDPSWHFCQRILPKKTDDLTVVGEYASKVYRYMKITVEPCGTTSKSKRERSELSERNGHNT